MFEKLILQKSESFKSVPMKIQVIIDSIQQFAPLTYQEHYDNAGLLTGNPDWEVTNALLTLDATEPVIDEAIERGCNLVIAHHPIIFGGLKKLTGKSYVERTVIKAIKNDIAIYAAHTNLDNVQQGVNNMICERLHLVNRRILSPTRQTLRKLYTFAPFQEAEKVRQTLFDAGAGHIGHYSESSFNTEGTGTFKGDESTHPHVGQKGQQHHEPEIKIEVIFPEHLEKKLLQALFAIHPYEEVAYDIIGLENNNQQIGSGMVGELQEPMEELEFLHFLKDKMEVGS